MKHYCNKHRSECEFLPLADGERRDTGHWFLTGLNTARLGGDATAVLHASAFADLHGHATASLYGHAEATVIGPAEVTLYGNSYATLLLDAVAALYNHANAEAWGTSKVTLHDCARVLAHADDATIIDLRTAMQGEPETDADTPCACFTKAALIYSPEEDEMTTINRVPEHLLRAALEGKGPFDMELRKAILAYKSLANPADGPEDANIWIHGWMRWAFNNPKDSTETTCQVCGKTAKNDNVHPCRFDRACGWRRLRDE